MYVVRALQFIVKGKSQFTQKGYIAHSKQFEQEENQDEVRGQHIIITGANSGIGFSAAVQLSQLGAYIHLVCRNKQRGEEAINELIKQNPTSQDKVFLHLCDIGDMNSIRSFVQEYTLKQFPLDCLVQNAGLMIQQKEFSKDGIEINFATNVVGTFLLTELMIPLLMKSQKGGKVIVVSSGGMLTQTLEIQDFEMKKSTFDGTKQYAKNKRQQVALCEKWAQLYSQPNKSIQSPVMFYSMHPGWVDTPALPAAMPDFYKKFKGELRNCEQGADTIVWLAYKKTEKLQSGGFYFDRKQADKHLTVSLTSHSQKELDSLYSQLRVISNLSE